MRSHEVAKPPQGHAWLVPGTHCVVALVVAAYIVTLLKCAWLSDDYFITLRQLEQVQGHRDDGGPSQWLWAGRGPARVIAAAMALVPLYVILMGADYMGGRFFSVPYVLLVALPTGTSNSWKAYLRLEI